MRAIGWFYDDQSQSRTRINYQALNTEEFGSVYESLLELHPQISGSGANLRFSLGGVAGSERKTSGSYYTPEDLVRLLILSALLPVIRDRLSKATTQQEKGKPYWRFGCWTPPAVAAISCWQRHAGWLWSWRG